MTIRLSCDIMNTQIVQCGKDGENMKNRLFTLMLLLLCAILLVSCQQTPDNQQTPSFEQETNQADGSFSPSAYFDIEETDDTLTESQFRSVSAQIPSDTYEAYPQTHGAPLTATLYKNGEVYEIDANDPRLISLTNFFNNCVYYSKCAYTQGLLSAKDIEEDVTGADFRLELTYTPYGENGPMPYGNETSRCDTIIFTNFNGCVTLIAHDLPGYEGQEDQYPFRAVGFLPLYDAYPLLELFGF